MNNNQNLYHELREKYPEFIYSGYSITESGHALNLDFYFEIPGLARFQPHWEIDKPKDSESDLSDNRLQTLAFSLGLVELISYWKLTCSPLVQIDCGFLSSEQVAWWKKLYKKGLGEFFYTNGIEPDEDFMTIISEGEILPRLDVQAGQSANTRVLIPIGGGKDSAVTLELLKDFAERFCYIINPREATLNTVTAGKIPPENLIIAKRTLDKNMLELNRRGFLNGHTPFSALVAFSGVIAAYMHGIGFVALSNESSANESTVPGSDVNHQYSKSLEFESDFVSYEKEYIASNVKYFSLLRPLTEIGIAKIFASLENYHQIFRSCNVGSKQDIWCANCPKCLFVYIILSAFLPQEEMVQIFGKDMLDDIQMKDTFEKLVGVQSEKPFECVGSRDEVNAAMQEILRQYENQRKALPKLLDYYKNLGVTQSYDIGTMCAVYDESNLVPEKFVQAIKNRLG